MRRIRGFGRRDGDANGVGCRRESDSFAEIVGCLADRDGTTRRRNHHGFDRIRLGCTVSFAIGGSRLTAANLSGYDLFRPTPLIATVSVYRAAVVALLAPGIRHPVTTDGAWLDFAGRSASVARNPVAVVARFAGLYDAVAAARCRCARRRGGRRDCGGRGGWECKRLNASVLGIDDVESTKNPVHRDTTGDVELAWARTLGSVDSADFPKE